MSQPDQTPTEIDRDAGPATGQATTPLGGGTDVTVDPAALDDPIERPATSDPAEMTEDEALGGVGGGTPGGAG